MHNRYLSTRPCGSRRGPFLAVAAAITLAAVADPLPALAEDEDSATHVYLVFDPETGEFIKSEDPDAALPPQTGLDAVGSVDTDATGGRNMTIFATIAAALLFAGGGFGFLRSRRKPA